MASSDFFARVPEVHPAAIGVALEGRSERVRELEEQLSTLRLEFASVFRELYEGAQMQRHLSGPRLLCRGDFEIAAEIFPVRHLSGDFFTVSESADTILVGVGDIAGKGVLAAMWFTHLLGLTRIYGEACPDPAVALAAMNSQICAIASPMTSMFLARLDAVTGELVYCNAGHPAPILLAADGNLRCLDEGGPVLGAVSSAQFACGRATLQEGDTLVGYSDGLLECRSEHGEEFGIERCIREVAGAAGLPTSAMLFSVIGAAQDFAGSNAREDDCTLIVVQRKAEHEM